MKAQFERVGGNARMSGGGGGVGMKLVDVGYGTEAHGLIRFGDGSHGWTHLNTEFRYEYRWCSGGDVAAEMLKRLAAQGYEFRINE